MHTNHFIDLNDYSLSDINIILDSAINLINNNCEYSKLLNNNILATLFFEPSTRTMFSFQASFLKLGGQYIGFSDPNLSSVSKGESFTDTIKTVSSYSDFIVIRHPLEGSAKLASQYTDIPIINAGDGIHLHPSQTLTDLVTILAELGSLSNLTIGVCGDLKNGRTVHSLIKACSLFPNNKFILISSAELKLPKYILEYIKQHNCSFEIVDNLDKSIDSLDILYMTRTQKERFKDTNTYLTQKDRYVLDVTMLNKAKPSLKIMHPFPRTNELPENIDGHPSAIYFKQIKYGMFARMALFSCIKQGLIKANYSNGLTIENIYCKNTNCVSTNINNFKHLVKHNINCRYQCYYCETIISN